MKNKSQRSILTGAPPEDVFTKITTNTNFIETADETAGDVGKPEDGVQAAQEIGCFRRRERDDDGQEGVDEPGTSFLAFSGMGKIIFELSEELV